MPALEPLPTPVEELLAEVDGPARRADSEALIELMRAASGEEPTVWGGSIIGFGTYHYRYASGHEGDAPLVGFSPRRTAISLYLTTEEGPRAALLPRLGKHRSGKSCVYVNRLSDVDLDVLKELIDETVAFARSVDSSGQTA